MIQTKQYQERVLESLKEYLRECGRDTPPEQAFLNIQARHNQRPAVYLPLAVAGLTSLPYICIRVPTGGGKTLLGCYTAGIAVSDFLKLDRGIVLWLVPSKTILEQTAEALRNPKHDYRRALELSCGNVEVFTIEEALNLPRARLDGQTSVIIGTIQSFRVEDTTGRKVYETNGLLMDHFSTTPTNAVSELFLGPDGKPKPSLVNVLRMRHPVVIVDEAHNARTDLSFSTLGALLPSCIIEFTATPSRTVNPSNVLHSVSAYELKAEKMIKLPLRIITRHPSQKDELLSDAVNLRSELEKRAIHESQETMEYLRPIMLIQAERVDGCEELRNRMVTDFHIAREQIKISTGKVDELAAVHNIEASDCPVRFIITVEKLREGWDCPFAYVLCSLKETHSATAIEQIVGRILRLPKAKERKNPDLNCAYAFSVSSSLPEVLNEFREALESNGFTRTEAERAIVPVTQGILPLSVQAQTIHFDPGTEIVDDVARIQADALGGKVQIDTKAGDIKILVPLDENETERLLSCVSSPEAKAKVLDIVAQVAQTERAFGGSGLTRQPSPYELRLNFVVPKLVVEQHGTLFDFDSTLLMEWPWYLSDKDASLPESYNPLLRPHSKAGILDVTGAGSVQVTEIREPSAAYNAGQQRIMPTGEWTLESLVSWLDSRIHHEDIPVEESAAFITKVILGLVARFSISDIKILVLDRFRLADEIETLIQHHRIDERKKAFQHLLLPQSGLQVNSLEGLNYAVTPYEPSWLYNGSYEFRNHYYRKAGELLEKTPSGETLTEEFLCAQFLDNMPEIKFWVRNLSGRNTSFRLHTSTDWFYPDFVCQLKDGRVLVVEYKGKYIFDSLDATEKRVIGSVWEERSQGRCLFVMPTDRDFGVIEKKVRG